MMIISGENLSFGNAIDNFVSHDKLRHKYGTSGYINEAETPLVSMVAVSTKKCARSAGVSCKRKERSNTKKAR